GGRRGQDSVEAALLARPEECDPVRLPCAGHGFPRNAGDGTEPERGRRDRDQPPPAGIAEGGGISPPPGPDGGLWIGLREHLVHRLNVRGPGPERVDPVEYGMHHRIAPARRITRSIGAPNGYSTDHSSSRVDQRCAKARTRSSARRSRL